VPAASTGERVGQRPPGEAGDVAEVACERDGAAERLGHVTSVDPGFGQTGGGERPDRQLARHLGHPLVVVGCEQDPTQLGRPVAPARQEIAGRRAPLSGDHQRGAVVDVSRRGGASGETLEDSGEQPVALPIAISLVCARWSTTSATSQPSQRVGRRQPSSSSGSSSAVSAFCWYSRPSTTLAVASMAAPLHDAGMPVDTADFAFERVANAVILAPTVVSSWAVIVNSDMSLPR